MKVLVGGDVSTFPQTSGKTTELGAGEASFSSINQSQWRLAWDRRAVFADLKESAESDPLVSTALDIIADCATGYEATDVDSFEWLIDRGDAKSKAALVILDEMKQRLELGSECWQLVRGFVQNGEEFREIVWDEDGIARRLKHLPSYQIFPMLDGYGNKQPGYYQKIEGAQYGKPILFPEWAMLMFVYGARRSGWMGTGLMLPARRTWKRLVKMEDGMALARLVRAYDKYLHKVPVRPDWDLDRCVRAITEYKRSMTIRTGMDETNNLFVRERPFAVETDFYIPDDGSGKGGMELMSAQNQQLMNIDDVLYHQALLMARLKVPSKYLNLVRRSGALTDAGLSSEDIQFARTLRQVQAVLRGGLIRLAHYALAFQGWDSDELGVGVNLPKISTDDQYQDAKIKFTLAQAADLFSQVLGGLPPALVAEKFMQLNDSEQEVLMEWIDDRDEANAELQKQMLATGQNPAQMPGMEAAPRRDGNGRFRNPAANLNPGAAKGSSDGDDDAGGGTDDQGAPFGMVADALTTLQMLTQNELEKRGEKFNLGRSERLDRTREALWERIEENRNGHAVL